MEISKLEDRLYQSSEVAKILDVSLRTIYRYLEQGRLKAETKTRAGKHLFTKQAILDFLYPKKKEAAEVKKEIVPQKPEPLKYTKEGALRPLHERDILKSD